MKKYLFAICLVLLFILSGFSQDSSKPFKVEDSVRVERWTDKTAIFVGDRFKLFLEITYPKDLGIEILTEDLEDSSIRASLPPSVELEKAEVFKPIPCGDYYLKLKSVYTLFYPEKKHDTGILFFSQEEEEKEPLKIRFKVTGKDEDVEKNVKVYELEVKQFVLGVRSLLTDTSDRPRESGLLYENFLVKAALAFFVALLITTWVVIKFVKGIIRAFSKTDKRIKEKSVKQIIKEKIKALRQLDLTDSRLFCGELTVIIKEVIGAKTNKKILGMTACEIATIANEDKHLIELAKILEISEDYSYNPNAIEPNCKNMTCGVIKILKEWLVPKWLRIFKRGR